MHDADIELAGAHALPPHLTGRSAIVTRHRINTISALTGDS